MIDKFTISREKWLNRQGIGEGFLLNADGCGCALGHYCLASGVSADSILGRAWIGNPKFKHPFIPELNAEFDYSLIHESLRPNEEGRASKKAAAIADTNDNDEWDQEIVETTLISEFALIGVTLTFTE